MSAADKRARRKGCLRVGLIFFNGFVALIGVGVFTYSRFAMSERDEEFRLAVAAGLPKSWEDLRKTYSPDRDAREPLKAFSEAWAAADKRSEAIALEAGRRNDNSWEADIVRAQPELATMVAEVLSRSELNMFDEPELGFQVDFGRLTQTKSVMNYTGAKAAVLSKDGDPIAALKTLQESSKLLKLIRQDSSTLIAELVGSINEAILVTSAQQILQKHGRQPAIQTEALRLLDNLGRPGDVKRGLVGEFAGQLVEEQTLKTRGEAYYDKFLGPEPLPFEDEEEEARDPRAENLRLRLHIPGTRDVIFKNLYRAFRELYKDLPDDPSDGFARLQVAKKHSKLANSKSGELEFLVPMTIGSATSAIKSDLRGLVYRRTIKALILAQQIRTKTGSFPTELPLTGQEAIDPFSGEKLKFKQIDGHLVAYSVGEDGVDNGGMDAISWKMFAKDIGFGIL